jgi:hypothetical protein
MEYHHEDEISVKELAQEISAIWKYLRGHWLRIAVLGFLGAIIGFYAAWVKPVKYVGSIRFVAEESKAVGGGLASLAGQFGLDLGGASGGGFFSGENMLLFLKSKSLVRQTLLTSLEGDETTTLADRYAEVYGLKKNWVENPNIGSVNFSSHRNLNFSRKEDSLLQVVVSSVIKDLEVIRPEKKATFVEVTVKTIDEMFSKLFVERLVTACTNRYIQSKTSLKAANVALLQKRADSLGALLNNTTYRAAVSQQALVDINPALKTALVTSEISSREKMMLATIFGEVVKNLELAKFTLSQETPVIQIVDASYLPLTKEEPSNFRWMLIGGFIAGFLAIAFLLFVRWWQKVIL